MNGVLRNVLELLDGVRRSGAGYIARCPAHDDQHVSLSVSLGDDMRVLVHCHAGCETEDVCKGIGLRLPDLFPPTNSTNGCGRIVATYDYKDASGTLLFQVVRFDPKTFRQRRADGNGGWIWKLGRTPRMLYRLPELLAAGPDECVFVAEGEKDADRLASVGLIATCNPGGAGKWARVSDDSVLDGRRVAIIADKDKSGRAHAKDVARRLHGRVADLRMLELPGPGKDVSDWFDAGGTADQLRELVDDTPSYVPPTETIADSQPNEHEDRPLILIDTDEHRVASETIATLAADPNIFQRGGMLVRVLRSTHPRDGITRRRGSATTSPVPMANLRERITRCANFAKLDSEGQERLVHPPTWLVSAIDARGDWPEIRRLWGVSDVPVLRADGSIWQTPGFDSSTCVLYEPTATFPIIPDSISIDDARASMVELLDVVGDFCFEGEEHKAAWLAGLLTPLARFAFDGPTPLFLIDANVPGAGKGLLAQTIGSIVLGYEMPMSSYVHDSHELRKKITAIAIAGDRLILFDNLTGLFGNDTLDRALTATRWKDRLLGKSQEIDLPLIPAWFATGNNVQVSADTARRIIHIRIDILEEHPEDRTGFKHENLLQWIRKHRGDLLVRAMTILAGYCRAGCRSSLTPYGSFEGWSSIVREAVAWVGLPDPCATRTRLTQSLDTTAEALGLFLAACAQYIGCKKDFVVAELVNRLYAAQRESVEGEDAPSTLRAALENLVGCPPGKSPTPRLVGNKLRQFRQRVVGGLYIDVVSGRSKQGVVWRLCQTEKDA